MEYRDFETTNKEVQKKWDNWFLKSFPYSHKVVMLKKTGLFSDEQINSILKKAEWDDEIFYFIKALLIAQDGLKSLDFD